MPAEPSGDHEQTPQVDSLIDDLIHDILSDAGRAPGAAARGRPSPASSLIDLILTQGARGAGGSLVERVLLAEMLAGAIADALAPALAEALTPRLLQVMEGEGGGAPTHGRRPDATKSTPSTPPTPSSPASRKSDAK
ncbi:hypothetical protein ACFFX1_07225 [Dactylosporangium sucinum]|uniref:Uncharacterized protein n=1 Tax=Dactylosporangium sucinum TaxID=1424081 RepID=A0A917UA71_9ACTN|nr:hypothetical protein [Dactylosporangium sucinum]GGM70328.1 hypothetical protein GCM10007977_085160 [Dactylosporangium sucinum]